MPNAEAIGQRKNFIIRNSLFDIRYSLSCLCVRTSLETRPHKFRLLLVPIPGDDELFPRFFGNYVSSRDLAGAHSFCIVAAAVIHPTPEGA
jgi:hypothetical protein